MRYKTEKTRVLLVAVVVMILVAASVPMATESDATDGYYTVTLTASGSDSDTSISVTYNGVAATSISNVTTSGATAGTWTWDTTTGIGPFNSFYVALDASNGNAFVAILNPYDLTETIGGTSISGKGYNVVWVLPTVYWYTDDLGTLYLTNDPDAGGTAWAHTMDGKTWNYIAYGVYEATGTGSTLGSVSGASPTVNYSLQEFCNDASSLTVSLDGTSDGLATVWNYYQWSLYKYVALAVMGDWDSQSIAGWGNSSGSSASTTGSLDAAGPYAGNTLTHTSASVKVFLENAWGSVYEWVSGVANPQGTIYIDQSANSVDVISGTYVTAFGTFSDGDVDGYGSIQTTSDQFWGMPTASNGSDSEGTCDYVWYYSSGDDDYPSVLFVGGSWSDSSIGGLSYADIDVTSDFGDDCIGSRLAFAFDAVPASTDPGEDTQITIGSTPASTSVVEGYPWTYTVSTNVSDPTVSVTVNGSSVSWISVSGATITADAPESPGSYTVVVTVSKSGYLSATQTITLTIVDALEFTTVPTVSVNVTVNNGTLSLDATSSEDYHSIAWYVDGELACYGDTAEIQVPTGTHTISMVATNNVGTAAWSMEYTGSDGEIPTWVLVFLAVAVIAAIACLIWMPVLAIIPIAAIVIVLIAEVFL